MKQNMILGLLWLGVGVYAFGFAPPNQPDTPELLQNLLTLQWDGINPLIIALFNIMGVWPMIYSALLLFDGRTQRVKAWPFVLLSFGVGAFALLPYLALRQPNQSFSGQKDKQLQLLDSRWLGIVLTLSAVLLVAYGAIAGDWSDFVQRWQSDRFVHVMSLDFCLLCCLFPIVLWDDMARRGWGDRRLFWAVSLLPLVGSAAYLALRPPLPAASELIPQAAPTLSAKP